MDLWDKAIGKELAPKRRKKEGLAKAVHEALRVGRLITYPGESRV